MSVSSYDVAMARNELAAMKARETAITLSALGFFFAVAAAAEYSRNNYWY